MLHHPFSYIQRRRSRRRRVTDSVLAGIRRHYAKVVDILSYVGLGLVLYAGELPGLSAGDELLEVMLQVMSQEAGNPCLVLRIALFAVCSMPSRHSATQCTTACTLVAPSLLQPHTCACHEHHATDLWIPAPAGDPSTWRASACAADT